MKILSAEQIRIVDQRTMKYENITSIQLMEDASNAFFQWFIKEFPDKSGKIAICCGVGNNGGDGLVVARLLSRAGYDVRISIVEFSTHYSNDFLHNLKRVEKLHLEPVFLSDEKELPDFTEFEILIDAIFGTGLSRTVEGLAYEVIRKINASKKTVVSIDVPSGMFLDRHTRLAINADFTVTFQIPKFAYFFPQSQQFLGKVSIVNIGLSRKAIQKAETTTYLTELEDIALKLKPLITFSHKGTQGHACIVGGSLGKIGSVILSSKGALRAGCGLVTTFIPKCGTLPVQAHFPEAMVVEDKSDNFISEIIFDFTPDAIGVGVGMGQHDVTQKALYHFLRCNKAPLVIDADGLNILSKHLSWIDLLPSGTILTPHPKELSRLIGSWTDDFDKVKKIQHFVKKQDVILILKGAFSMIFDAENVYVNSSGTPALATAGSGDVLTGIITSLRAQGYAPLDAAIIGVFVHGFTAHSSLHEIHPRSFLASDTIENIGKVYQYIENSASGLKQKP